MLDICRWKPSLSEAYHALPVQAMTLAAAPERLEPATGLNLNGMQFDSLLEAQVFTEDWRIDYNLNRPHSAHGELTPSEFAKAWADQYQPVLA